MHTALVTVHPQDRLLLGMWWNKLWIACYCLAIDQPPKIFTVIANTLEWVLSLQGVAQVYHYLDNFIALCEPEQETCACNQECIIKREGECPTPYS